MAPPIMDFKTTPQKLHRRHHYCHKGVVLHRRYLHLLLIVLTFPFYSSKSLFNMNDGGSHQATRFSYISLVPSLYSTSSLVLLMTLSTHIGGVECSPQNLVSQLIPGVSIDPLIPLTENSAPSSKVVPRSSPATTTVPSQGSDSNPNPSPYISPDSPSDAQPTQTADSSQGGKATGCLSHNCRYESSSGVISGTAQPRTKATGVQGGSRSHPTTSSSATKGGQYPEYPGDNNQDHGRNFHRLFSPFIFAMISMAVVVMVAAIVIAVVTVRRRRQKRGFDDNDYLIRRDRQPQPRMVLLPFSYKGSRMSEPPRQPEQFWNA